MRLDKHITISTEESRNEVGQTYHYKYRRIQKRDRRSVPLSISKNTGTRSAQRSTLSTAAYRQKSTTQHTQQRRTPSVPNGVGARGMAFGLRNSEIAFPRTYRIENATGVAHSAKRLIKNNIYIKDNKFIINREI